MFVFIYRSLCSAFFRPMRALAPLVVNGAGKGRFVFCCIAALCFYYMPLVSSAEIATETTTGPPINDFLRVPIYGSIYQYAYYFVDVFVGSSFPPQRQSVILDSGSSLLAFPCDFCSECGTHLDPPYDMTKSSTAHFVECDGRCPCEPETNRCKYVVQYEEGSKISGYYIKDRIQLGINIKPQGRFNETEPVNQTDLKFEPETPARRALTQLKSALEHMQSFLRSGKRVLSIPSVTTSAYMGCHKQETNLFVSQEASGVMGISFRSDDEEPTVMNSMFEEHGFSNRVFAICLSHFGGELTVGGFSNWQVKPFQTLSAVDSHVTDEPVTFVPLVSRKNYSIAVRGLHIGSETISKQIDFEAPAMLDTGTTYTLFPQWVLDRLLEALEQICDASSENCRAKWTHGKQKITSPSLTSRCWKLSETMDLNTFPMITIQLRDGVKVDFPPSSYMFPKHNTRVWCLGVREHPKDGLVLGATFFTNKNIIFDLDALQIGIIDTMCPTYKKRPSLEEQVNGAPLFDGARQNSSSASGRTPIEWIGEPSIPVAVLSASGVTMLFLFAAFASVCFFVERNNRKTFVTL
eukprot:Selendium_serpulae@DN4099_c0_g1_i1.p1